MKIRLYKGLIALIAILVANIATFLLMSDFTITFWFSYAFGMIAMLLTTYINVFCTHKEKLIFGYTISGVSYLYLVVELVIAILSVVVLSWKPLWVFLIQLIVLATFGIVFLEVLLMHSNIKEQQGERARDILNFKYTLERFKEVQRQIPYSATYRKVVEHSYDALASGQIKSSIEAQDTEIKILDKIEELKKAVGGNEESEIIRVSKEIEDLAEERKRILSCRVNF